MSDQRVSRHPESWRLVDEGWGRRASDFATLSEPANAREYVALQHHLGIDAGHRVLDLACGSGLALELASLRGASVAGIDASARLIAIARDRLPDGDVRVGDMHALPWEDDSFDVVTSFRGIWGTTPQALAEARRVLVPGGRLGFTVWGHIKKSPGAWSLAPLRLASQPKVENQAAMVALGRPGAGEELLARYGFEDIERIVVPFAWEFADPESYARALASTGPAYEAIQSVGENEFLCRAAETAAEHVRDGLPLRATIDVVGYVARKPAGITARPAASRSSGAGFLGPAEETPQVRRLFDEDVEDMGFVMNASRLWAHLPDQLDALFALMGQVVSPVSLRERGILVTATASTLGDSYCSLAWGKKLAGFADADLAAGVLTGEDAGLTESEQALATWARRVAGDPNGIKAGDVESLRTVGYDDAQILAITLFVALRLAFSTVNDALGARPDRQLGDSVPAPVRAAVTWGRPVED
ncbi:MAG: methyltransferase domain-containing protein [Actinomycetota bacterium]|nr:methyltransferase domain-containing protein [Actinomycetota bacterium]